MIQQFRDPRLSLWQSAIDQSIASEVKADLEKSADGGGVLRERPDYQQQLVRDAGRICEAINQNASEQELQKGAFEVVGRCSGLAFKAAGTLVKNIILGHPLDENKYKEDLKEKFGSCDPRYANAAILYAKFLSEGSQIPYRRHASVSDFVIEDLPENATIGLLGDWGTGQREAWTVLRQVSRKNPQIVIHLGDIYYAGTEFEVKNYFYKPWQTILHENGNPRTFTLAGNHDMYSGGKPFYDLLDQLKQPASYFCLRNRNWQIIGLDTGLHAKLGLEPTFLEPSEVEWLLDKMQNGSGRRTVLLSHHQLYSADEQFKGQSFNIDLYKQTCTALTKVDLWLWGHEHNLVIFEPYMNLKRGRCIGCGAFPVGAGELTTSHKNSDVPLKPIHLSRRGDFYQHGYAVVTLNDAAAKVDYYQDGDENTPLYSEVL